MPSAERSRLPAAFGAGLVIVTLLIGAAVLLSRYSTPGGPEVLKPLPMGPTEQAYAPQIHFLEPKMSRAANFLVQEVGGAAHLRFEKVNLRSVGLFGRAHRERLQHFRSPWRGVAAEQHGSANQKRDDHQSGAEGCGEPASFCRRHHLSVPPHTCRGFVMV